jgi:uncharacterized protein HemY
MCYLENKFGFYMYILSTIIQNPGFSHPLRLIAVYLVIFFLTTGICTKTYADSGSAETQNASLLYNVLIAEIAASRNMKQTALDYYLKAIKQTNDPAITETSTLLAIALEAPKEALISAKLWAKQAPNNLQAHLITMTLLISHSVDDAIPYLTKIIDLDPTQPDHALMEVQSRLSESSAKNLKTALNTIALAQPTNAYAHLIAAESAVEQRDIKSATHWVDSALKNMPDLTGAIELKARLIRYQKKSDRPAIHFIKTQLDKFPSNNELRFFYASVLLDNDNTAEAKIQLRQLTEDAKYGGAAFLVLGDLSIKEKNWKEASRVLKKAQSFSESKSGAEYLLGELEEFQGNKTAAIERYTSVTQGSYHMPATLRAIALLKDMQAYDDAIYLIHNSTPTTFEEQKQLLLVEIDLLNISNRSEEALQLVNDVLKKLPNDKELLETLQKLEADL